MFERMLAIGEDGQPQASGEWQITDEMRQAIDVLAAKLAKGIYWRHTQDIFPNDGGLAMTWYTNADVARDGGYKLPAAPRRQRAVADAIGHLPEPSVRIQVLALTREAHPDNAGQIRERVRFRGVRQHHARTAGEEHSSRGR
jgi:hypothetical protein